MKIPIRPARIMETILVLFIVSFLYRAIPNVDVIPNLPLANGQVDDKTWGTYTRMEFLATRPAPVPPTFKPVPEQKFWLQRPRTIEV
jgi:hypothetical protein